ncbi:hypothetical protein DTQ70_20160 [Runella sp. SP2]|nr:hypothetical protein DTQ70_20160 [Runella sp. SP2]HAK76559.1 hypothetical protein [Runella sp.]HAO49804.1 hypothetical protein [Runella sp.]
MLLDENLPTKLKYRFESTTLAVTTIRDQNWLGKKNGELLRLMLDNGFHVLVTNDKSIRYQQNTYNIPLFILQLNLFSNRYDDILPQVPKIQEVLIKLYHDIENEGFPVTLTTVDL